MGGYRLWGNTRSWCKIYGNTKRYFGQRQILYSKEFGRQSEDGIFILVLQMKRKNSTKYTRRT